MGSAGRPRRWVAIAAVGLAMIGCSSTEDADDAGDATLTESSIDSTTEATAAPTDQSTADQSTAGQSSTDGDAASELTSMPSPPPTTGEPTAQAPQPAPARPRRPGSQTGNSAALWLGRGTMTDTSIELYMALSDEADGDFSLHRLPFDEVADPIVASLDDATLIYRGPAATVIDDRVERDGHYWYVATVRAVDGTEYRQATEAEAVTDTQPPAPVTNLTATVDREANTVTVSWAASSDNHRFGRYAIRRSHNAEQSIYYGTGWTVDQTTFVDDQPPEGGTLTYEVSAVDFHSNATEPTTVSVNLD